jgi:hypothetical protein
VTPGLPARPNHYYKAYSRQSKFFFVGDASGPVDLRLTCRLPVKAPQGSVMRLHVNGEFQAEIDLTCKWENWAIRITAHALVDGVNEIALHWPDPIYQGRKDIERSAADIMQALAPEFYGVFGEIHMFTASGPGKERRMDSIQHDPALVSSEST